MKVILTEHGEYDELVTVREKLYRDALVEISDYTVKNRDYESAYFDIVVIADAALYPEEYSRKDETGE